MDSCIFCKIVAGQIPSSKVYEDDLVYAFNDINPLAPVHVLIIPKEHILASAADATEENAALIGHVFAVAAKLAKELGLDGGFRIVTNSGDDACQTVHHLHFHLLGGKKMSEDLA
ncbi:MAG: histidine triad nucleotide-binding protein [Ruminococcaceae bacterium]|nr:histidine triad nucleotide-binding protein [Oscillospiraceae bacterium]